MTFLHLWRVEARRALHRPMVWVLVSLALIGIALLGLVAFLSSTDLNAAVTHAKGETHPAIMADWFIPGEPDNVVSVTSVFLLMGALIGGAALVGGEWRAGTVTTVLTWEPVRMRLHLARITAGLACAVVIGFLLEVVMLLALLPAVFLNGTTAGVDAGWYADLAVAVGRLAVLAGLAAAVGAALAFIARNTAGAIVAVWAWLVIVEGLVRAHKPGLTGWLLGDNLARIVSWGDLETGAVRRSPWAAAITVVLCVGILAVASALHFRRADIAAT